MATMTMATTGRTRATALAAFAALSLLLLFLVSEKKTTTSSSTRTAERILHDTSTSPFRQQRWNKEAIDVNSQDNSDHSDYENEVENSDIRAYELWDSGEIATEVRRWADHYPNLLRVTTSQQAFGLPTTGSAKDCAFEAEYADYNTLGVGCRNYILTIQDFVAHPEGSESSKHLPEVFWSGELHGNERVGPTAVLEAAQLLLDAATCEELPRISIQNTQSHGKVWYGELKRARDCRAALLQRHGLDDASRQWLARLVTTRRIVIVPTANALGYDQNVREENGIDPNRDFPYDLRDPSKCMQTIAGRTINEVFRQHLFQLSLTFHGGMQVIGYEWGAPHWQEESGRQKASPDDAAQAAIAQTYSRFAGGWSSTRPYATGSMNEQVYPVEGGMEDWAYAGSWDPKRVPQCDPATYGKYPAAKTIYDNSTLRVFNMLVETSDNKQPSTELGTSEDILGNSGVGNGHVARNIRLALMAAELVEPYVAFRTVNDMKLSDDLIPLTVRDETSCQTTHSVVVPHNQKVTVQFEVGGALSVDQTSVYYAKWDATLESLLTCQAQPNWATLMPRLKPATSVGPTTGTTRLATGATTMAAATPTLFAASINMDGYNAGDRIAVVAVARVDQAWGVPLTSDVTPKLPPQSHMANVRTNPSWQHSTVDGSSVIQGRLDWVSVPLTLVLDKSATSTTHALAIRYDASLVLPLKTTSSNTSDSIQQATDWTVIILVVVGVLVLAIVIGRAYLHHTMRQSHRDRVREFIEDESAVSPGLQQIAAVLEKNGTNHVHATQSAKKGGYSDVAVSADSENGGLEMGTYS